MMSPMMNVWTAMADADDTARRERERGQEELCVEANSNNNARNGINWRLKVLKTTPKAAQRRSFRRRLTAWNALSAPGNRFDRSLHTENHSKPTEREAGLVRISQ